MNKLMYLIFLGEFAICILVQSPYFGPLVPFLRNLRNSTLVLVILNAYNMHAIDV